MGRREVSLHCISLLTRIRQVHFLINLVFYKGLFLKKQSILVREHQSSIYLYLPSRSKPGERVAIHLPDAQALCYVYVAANKIAYAVLADDQYPERIIHLILRKMNM